MPKYPMSDKEREEAFPIHIPLGRKADLPMGGGKGKGKLHYPMVYVDAIPGLEQLPKEGCMLVEFRRKRLSIEENGDGESTAGVGLELRVFCLPENFPEDAADDLDAALSRFGQEEKPADEDSDDDYEEDEE
jgi:hypothetical protein